MDTDAYVPRQIARDAVYRREYEAWVNSLPPAERSRLKLAGLDEPLLDTNGSGISDHDLADSPLASETPDILGKVDHNLAEESAGKPVGTHEKPPESGSGDDPSENDPEAVWDVVRRLIGELLVQKNTKLAVECLALVSGVSFLGDSMSNLARRHRVTRAAVSKRCVELTEKLNMLPSRAMRSLTARRAYAHARNRHLQEHE